MSEATFLTEAEGAFLAGDLDRAESLAQRLIGGQPTRADALHLLGAIALRRRQVPDAIKWFEAAIEGGYKTPDSLNNCGEAYRLAGQLDRAFSCFQQSLMLDRENPYPHFNLGLVMRTWGQAPESEHFFRTALAINPVMARAHLELAELYRAEGHFPQAEAEYLDAIRVMQDRNSAAVYPRLNQSRIRYASFLRERGRPHDAVRLLEPFAEQIPENAELLLELAFSEFELAREKSSERHYRQAILAAPSSAGVESVRIAMARTGSIQEWCEAGRGRFRSLAPARRIQVPALKTIPAGQEAAFVDDQALAPELFCAEIPNGEVIPGDFGVMVDSQFFLHGVINWAYHYGTRGRQVRYESDDARLLLDLPVATRRVSGACVLLGAGNNQYQWLCETLPRVWVLSQFPEYAGLPVIVAADVSAAQLELLAKCGIADSQIMKVDQRETLTAERLIVPSLMATGHWVSPVALQFLRRAVGSGLLKGRRRIYLSRSACENRRVVNEAELLPLLRSYQFEVLDAGVLEGRAALEVFGESEIVIGTDDDLLSNMVAAPAGSNLGVIAMGGEHRPAAHYLCGPLSISATYLMGEIDYGSNSALALCDVRLPLAVLEEYLGALFNSGRGDAARQAGA